MLECRTGLTITVRPDLRVIVRAPAHRTIEQITHRVAARRSWVVRQLRAFEAYHPLPAPRRFVAGETHWYLGRQYRLRLVKCSSVRVSCSAGHILVSIPHPRRPADVERALQRWYSIRARLLFVARLHDIQRRLPLLRALKFTLRVRRLKHRWGSCSVNNTVTLNSELIRVPSACIDYVIVHELCHVMVPSHSPRFYRLLRSCMSDWEDRRLRLNRVAR